MTLPSDLPLWVPVALDTETSGLYADDGARVATVSLAWLDPAVIRGNLSETAEAVRRGSGMVSLALPFSQDRWIGRRELKPGFEPSLFDTEKSNPNLPEQAWPELLRWLAGRRIVMHNGKFDSEKMRYGPLGWSVPGMELLDLWTWDTMVAAIEIWPGQPANLEALASRLWGEHKLNKGAFEEHLKRNGKRYDLIPWEVMKPYAAKDAEHTIRLYYAQLAQIGLIGRDPSVNQRLLKDCQKQIEVAKSLYRMERAGIPYDRQASLDAAAELDRRRIELDQRLPFKPTPHAAKAHFFGPTGLNLMPYSTTEKGAPQFTDQVVTQIVKGYAADTEPGRLARIWQERTKLDTAVKMWYRPYANGLGSDGRLRTCFRQVARGRGDAEGGTRSGRFSVERVNLQAIPHDYRLTLMGQPWPVPTPRKLIGLAAAELEGWELWEFDLAQAELRLAAAWSNCDQMLSAFAEGRDLHGETTTELFHAKPGDSDFGFYRQIGKRANFTLCFGAGGKTLVNMIQKETGVTLSLDEGSRIVETWNSLYPQYRRAIDHWSHYVEQHHAVPLASERGFATGRRRLFDERELKFETHKAFNQLVQASLGEFAKDWNLATQAICDQHELGYVQGIGWTGLCLVIHDSQVLLLPEGELGALIAKQLAEAARELWDRFFNTPDPEGRVSTVAGFSEGKRW